MRATPRLKKEDCILIIQRLGYRVLVRQGGTVEVWAKAFPDKVSTFPTLERAVHALIAVEGM